MAVEGQAPVWLNDKFIQACIEGSNRNETVELIKSEISPAVPPGNNYASCLWRVEVHYKDSKQNSVQDSLIIKAPLTDGPVKELQDTFSDTEPLFYQQFLPIANKLLPNYEFSPKTYFSEYPNVIILEDMKFKGYLMADRCKQLDFDHCKLYATAAATMHAVSVAVHKEQPELVGKLGRQKGFSNDLKTSGPIKMLIEKGLEFFAEKIKIIPEYSKYTNLVNNLSFAIWNLLVDLFKPSETLNALYQGDPWTTNMMFKYDSCGKVAEVKLLDFQALGHGSPVSDLVYFIWTSANDDVRENNLEDFYHTYCNILNNRLEECKCSERLSYEQLMATVKALSPYTLVVASCFYPFLTNKTPLDMGALFTEMSAGKTDLIDAYYDEEYCTVKLPKLLKQLESVGAFDYIQKLQVYCP